MGSLEGLSKDSKKLQANFCAEEGSSRLFATFGRSCFVVTLLHENVEGGDDFFLKDSDFVGDEAQEHRVRGVACSHWRKGILKRDNQLAGLG